MSEFNRIREVSARQRGRLFLDKDIVPREILENILKFIDDKRIIIISGMTRGGKSTLLSEIMAQLDSKNREYCYINFEDEAFLDFEAKDFERLNEIAVELYGPRNYYLFDEDSKYKKL